METKLYLDYNTKHRISNQNTNLKTREQVSSLMVARSGNPLNSSGEPAFREKVNILVFAI